MGRGGDAVNPSLTIPLWQVLALGTTLLLSFFGFVFAVWRVTTSTRDQNTAQVVASARDAASKADDNEKSILKLRAELPLQYVRREDWIRNQTVIEAKLDALAEKLDQGGRSGC
jgi:hypothetical protein